MINLHNKTDLVYALKRLLFRTGKKLRLGLSTENFLAFCDFECDFEYSKFLNSFSTFFSKFKKSDKKKF